MIATTLASRASDAYARIRLPATESTIASGRASTSELATKASIGPDVLLRQLQSGRSTAAVATRIGPVEEANPARTTKPAATFSRGDAAEGGAALAAAAQSPAATNQAVPGAFRVTA